MGMAAFIASNQNRSLPAQMIANEKPGLLARLGRFGRWLDTHL